MKLVGDTILYNAIHANRAQQQILNFTWFTY